MPEADPPPKIELNEVMLAMDVVDTLRHQDSLVQRELNAEDRDQALIEKVRRIYASQGLVVSEDVVAQGVAALREERFTYRRPRWSFRLLLARIYVRRGRWIKIAAAAMAVLLVVFVAYRFVFVASKERGRQRQAQEITTRISQQQDRIQVAESRLKRVRSEVLNAEKKAVASKNKASKGLIANAHRQLGLADEKLSALSQLAVDAAGGNLPQKGGALDLRVSQRGELIQSLETHLDAAAAAVAAIDQSQALAGELDAVHAGLLSAARERAVTEKAQRLYQDGLSAVSRGDSQAAARELANLQQLLQRVSQEYELRVVSRPDSPSGIWRYPEKNPNSRNYYLIVEAVAPGEKRLSMTVTSEEDAKTRTVKQWGVRVSADAFEAVKQDKQDNGIVDRNRVGVKRRGYLDPQYLIPVQGGIITQW